MAANCKLAGATCRDVANFGSGHDGRIGPARLEDPAFLLWFFALLHLRAHGREPQSLSAGHWSPPYEPAQPSQKIIHHSWPARLRPILKRWQQHGRWHAGKVMPRPPEAGAHGCRPCLEPGASTA